MGIGKRYTDAQIESMSNKLNSTPTKSIFCLNLAPKLGKGGKIFFSPRIEGKRAKVLSYKL
jgi:hypothetical protein